MEDAEVHGQANFVIGALAAITAIFGIGGVFRGWQMRSGKRLDLITDWDNKPVPDQAQHCAAFARVYLGVGVAMLTIPLWLWLGLSIFLATPLAAVALWYWFEAIDRIVARARSASPRQNK